MRCKFDFNLNVQEEKPDQHRGMVPNIDICSFIDCVETKEEMVNI